MQTLITSLSQSYQEVDFISLSMGTLDVLENSCDSIFKLIKDSDSTELYQKCLISRIMTIAILYIMYFAAKIKTG